MKLIESILARCVVFLARCLLFLRYRVKVTGLEAIARRGRKGIIFLPSHPALVDPVIVLSRLHGRFAPRALADREQVDRFFIRHVTKALGVIPMETLARGAGTAEATAEAIGQCAQVVNQGGTVVLYPAGHLLTSWREEIGANSGVATLLAQAPNARVVLIRTRGLWGSAFGHGQGQQLNVPRIIRNAIWQVLVSFIFFLPKRKVTLECVEPEDLPRDTDKATLNAYLEKFYNATPNPNLYVPYTLWQRRQRRELPEPERPNVSGDLDRVPPGTRELVSEYLREHADAEDITDSTDLGRDLGMDSLAFMELAAWLQDEFGSAPSDLDAFRTVGDVMLVAAGEVISARATFVGEVSGKWGRGQAPYHPPELTGMTIPEAFMHQAARDPKAAAIADQLSGVLTNRQVLVATRLLASKIAAMPGQHVGIMLPSSVAASLCFMAALLAGKTPAMLNWTLGRASLAHCIDIVGIEQIVTSRAFVDRLGRQGVDFEAIDGMLVFLEDIRSRITSGQKLRMALRAHLPGAFRFLRGDADAPAVILFTSGTESVPKAVPLTHRNLLTNVSDVYTCFTADEGDAMLGILPPFHSFGLMTSVILSLCTGFRTAYYPDPTDSASLGEMVNAYQTTLLASTPTFLSGILRAASRKKLSSLRLVVSGAEKCPEHVYDAMAAMCPGSVIMEGYGATECSPVISVNHEDDPRHGTIGRVLPSLTYRIVDENTYAPCQDGQLGMLLVSGPSVFDGYLHYGGPSPFVEIEGARWYRTGDLVTQDSDGIITFRGRLKRFIKVGGEMISLPAIESILVETFGEADEGPVLAVTDVGEEGKEEIVLFTTRPVDRAEANGALRAGGLSGLHNVRRVVIVETLPLLGTGKVDYRALRRLTET
jgi:acyl-CoA synthetase (AMP-forming)/AMP-acid ligase II/1-acyl-sn-glycerol-3-phosphate acyltransferase/acyl carrier protein